MDSVTFTEEILTGKLHFLRNVFLVKDVILSQIKLNEDLAKINNWAYWWKVRFSPHVSTQAYISHNNTRSIRPEVLLRNGVLKIWSKYTGKHPCRSGTSIRLQSNFIEITLQYWCSPVNLLHILRTTFLKNTSGRMHL